MPTQILRLQAYRNIPFDFTFSVGDPADADRFLSAAVPWVAGDIKVSLDGGATANIGSLPTRIGSTPLYRCSLTAAEMAAQQVAVYMVDAGGPAWSDLLALVETDFPDVLESGVAQAGSSTNITLRSGASATNDFYNGLLISIVGGTGVGQTRAISDYAGGSRQASVSVNWTTTPDVTSEYLIHRAAGNVVQFDHLEGAEPASASDLPDDATFRKIWQFVKRFIFDRVDQNATTRTLYKDDSATPLATMSITPGSTQSKGKIS